MTPIAGFDRETSSPEPAAPRVPRVAIVAAVAVAIGLVAIGAAWKWWSTMERADQMTPEERQASFAKQLAERGMAESGGAQGAAAGRAPGPVPPASAAPAPQPAAAAPAKPPDEPLYAGRPAAIWASRLELLRARTDEPGKALYDLTVQRAEANGLSVVAKGASLEVVPRPASAAATGPAPAPAPAAAPSAAPAQAAAPPPAPAASGAPAGTPPAAAGGAVR